MTKTTTKTKLQQKVDDLEMLAEHFWHLRQDRREAGNDGGKLMELDRQEKYLKREIAETKREIKAELDTIY